MFSYGSVCSGIEAASVAWHALGWRAAWFSEIEPFPSAVLKARFPDVPNLGDMTTIAARILAGEVEAPDLLVGGTPCQAFSLAGSRGGLTDPRGQLTLSFVELANAIDTVRTRQGKPPCIVVWENVPGVLSSRDNAFGCLLAGLAGETDPLQPAGAKWTHAGAVLGPQRTIAWRTLDAQYFRLAQRRRRVFLVGCAGNRIDPLAVLFEFDGVRRDSAPSRGARQKPAADAQRGPGARRPAEVAIAFAGYTEQDGSDVALCCSAHGPRFDADTETFVVQCATGVVTHALRAEGFDASEDGTGRGHPIVAHAVSLRGREGGNTAELGDAIMPAVRCGGGGSDKPHVLAFNARQDPDVWEERTGPLDTDGGSQAVAFQLSQSGLRLSTTHATLDANNGSRRAHGVLESLSVRRLMPVECERLQGFPDEHTLIPIRGTPAADGPRYRAIGNSMAVPCMRWIGVRIEAQLQHRGFIDDGP